MGMIQMTTTIELGIPITVDGAEVKTLEMRRPKVKDQMRHHDNGEMTPESTAAMYADLMMIKYDDVMELDMSDYQKVGQAYEDFLAPLAATQAPPNSEE